MELSKQAPPLEFKYKDVIFLIKPFATEMDRLEVWSAGETSNGKLIIPRGALTKVLVRCFVVDWRGITENGKSVPYSYETLITRFPKQGREEAPVLVQISNFILENTDVLKQDETEKKTSPSPQDG